MFFDDTKACIIHAGEVSKRVVDEDAFLIKPRFLPRGGRIMISGDTEVGKSWICLSMIRGLVLGEPLFGNPEWPCTRSNVLYLESEIGLSVPERLRMVFGDVAIDELPFYCFQRPEGFNLSYTQCQDWLKKQINEYKFDVVVLDPISDLTTVDENSNSDVNRLMMQLKDTFGETAMIFARHNSKPPRGEYAKDYDPLDINNSRGAGKFKDSIDSALMIARRPGLLNPNQEEESWINDARWAKVRHAKRRPSQGQLYFNEIGNGRMLWRDIPIGTSFKKAPPVTVPFG